MEESPKSIDRQVVPRWRQFSRTRSRELESAVQAEDNAKKILIRKRDDSIELAKIKWQQHSTLPSANEFVAAALQTSREKEAIGAARQIIAPNSTATDAAKHVANRLLSGNELASPDLTGDSAIEGFSERKDIHEKIHQTKKLVTFYPRNPLLLVELARFYSMIGQNEQASHSMEVALIMAPGNRFVLRSATRLLVHEGNSSRAHKILLKGEGVQNDPWLVAAEIAVADIANRAPRFVNRARDYLRREKHPPMQLSELAAALGTIEIASGARRRGQQFLKSSLNDPTDNTVAQVRWATEKIGISFDKRFLNVLASYEARAENAHSLGNVPGEVISNCMYWLRDEPFSTRPALLGSYTASGHLGDHELALKFADIGLIANPHSIGLQNNRVVALAKLGDKDGARAAISELEHNTAHDDPVIIATRGLVEFREGFVLEGRQYYEKAIKIAKEKKLRTVAIRAEAHLIEEEIFAGNFSVIDRLPELRKTFQDLNNRPLLGLWDMIEKTIATIKEPNK